MLGRGRPGSATSWRPGVGGSRGTGAGRRVASSWRRGRTEQGLLGRGRRLPGAGGSRGIGVGRGIASSWRRGQAGAVAWRRLEGVEGRRQGRKPYPAAAEG
jgi:hypothetical protein